LETDTAKQTRDFGLLQKKSRSEVVESGQCMGQQPGNKRKTSDGSGKPGGMLTRGAWNEKGKFKNSTGKGTEEERKAQGLLGVTVGV